MDLGLSGRVAIVTAGSKGLGRGAAEALAAEGASIVLNAHDPESLAATEAVLRATGVEVLVVPGDVTNPELPGALVDAAIERFGRLDILVTNSGGPPPARALEVTDDQVRAAVESNLLTHVRLVRAALPHLLSNEWGRICAIASFGVVQPIPNLALSNLARTGLRAWAKSAAHDLTGTGVTLNLLAPGLHLTDRMRSLGETGGPSGDPADFGRIVAFLCSVPANFVNGVTLVVDGGATLAL